MSKIKWCTTCKKQFRMIDMELAFYKKQGYPEPGQCPLYRQKRREALRNPYTFFHCACDKCGKKILTTHDPKKNLIIYCDECFSDYSNKTNIVQTHT